MEEARLGCISGGWKPGAVSCGTLPLLDTSPCMPRCPVRNESRFDGGRSVTGGKVPVTDDAVAGGDELGAAVEALSAHSNSFCCCNAVCAL